MREYQFQYSKIYQTVSIILGCILACVILICVGAYFKLQEFVILIFAPLAAIFLFQKLKKVAVHNCIAKLSDTSVEFDFGQDLQMINFNDLISFKAYYGYNGPVLYLKSNIDNFRISANNNYCKTANFKLFCEDIIVQLDKYKDNKNIALIHEGSSFATKGMLYFLITATSIYLLGFIIETKALRIAVGIGGGFYLLYMWLVYFIKTNEEQTKQ